MKSPEAIHEKQVKFEDYTNSRPKEEFLSPKAFLSPRSQKSEPDDSKSFATCSNSARFYKALKDFQQYADANILKEELWSTRKDIAKLEKIILDKTEEIRELKKNLFINPENNYEKLKNRLEIETYARKYAEFENFELKERIKDNSSSIELNESFVNMFKKLFESKIKTIAFEYNETIRRIFTKIKETEDKILHVVNFQ